MKNLLDNPHEIKRTLISLDNDIRISSSYQELGCTIRSLLKVCRGALFHIEDIKPCPTVLSPMDVSVCLEVISEMLPLTEMEMLDNLKEELK